MYYSKYIAILNVPIGIFNTNISFPVTKSKVVLTLKITFVHLSRLFGIYPLRLKVFQFEGRNIISNLAKIKTNLIGCLKSRDQVMLKMLNFT